MDLCLAILPWTILKRLGLNKKERIGVLIAMSMGVFAALTSIAKTAALGGISNPDTIATVGLMILATAEISLSIVGASIPSLRVLIKNTMNIHSVPHFYQYYRTETPSHFSPISSVLSSNGRHPAILSRVRRDSHFCDPIGLSATISRPDSALKRNWSSTKATDFGLQHCETATYERTGD